jgi:anti-sigma factor RsiW
MTIDAVVRTISLILAPVVMVTSCAIFLGGLLQRYEAISARMRALDRERLDLLRAAGAAALDAARLAEIDAQLPRLVRRHRLIRDALLAVYSAILVFIASMGVIAGATLTGSPRIAVAALLTFLLGTGVFLVGVAVTIVEIRRSHREVAYEVEQVLRLDRPPPH